MRRQKIRMLLFLVKEQERKEERERERRGQEKGERKARDQEVWKEKNQMMLDCFLVNRLGY